MNWFKHDSDATTDYKLKKLIMKYGTDGYAIYFHCLELIAGSISDTNITFELEHDAEIIADDLKVKGTQTQSAVDRVNEIMLYMLELKLFESSGDRIFCFKMLNRLDCSMTSSPRLRKMIAEAKESHDLVMTHHDSIMLEEKRREEIRREDNRIEEGTVPATPSPPSPDSGSDSTLFGESDNAQKKIKDTVPPRVDKKVFRKPTVDEVRAYCTERGNSIDPEYFVNYNESRGWVVGRLPMKDWRATIRTWEQHEKQYAKANGADEKGLRNGAKGKIDLWTECQ